jgi:mono/diheme cytochrome c family protein
MPESSRPYSVWFRRPLRWLFAGGTLLLLVAACDIAFASDAVVAQPSAEQLQFFESRIRPVFVEHCQKCHGPEKQWSGFRLDSREALLKGGEGGEAIVPGDPANSPLVRQIRHEDGEAAMPPKGKLSDLQIADIVKWVEMGAPYPASVRNPGERNRDPNHWSFQPVKRPEVPSVSGPVESPIDAFIRAKLNTAGLETAPPADRTTLIRRVTFDLTGLPPTPEEIDSFLADDRPTAYAELIDRLLASPAYGERWGRHWLDVARYADSNGLDENVAHGNAWKYRDYVIDAIHRDVPFNEFVVEQIAGDQLPSASLEEKHRRLIATGFLSLGAKVLAEPDGVRMRMDIVDEQIDTLGRAFLGMTLGCARCHDHKFDPLSTQDYYGLAGVFKSTKTMIDFKIVAKWHEHSLPTPESEAALATHQQTITEQKSKIDTFIAAANAEIVAEKNDATELSQEQKEAKYPEAKKAELKGLRDKLKQLEAATPEHPSAMGVVDEQVADVAVHLRGDHLKLGDIVPRHVPAVMQGPTAPAFKPDASGRLELARWLVDPAHPLTARVFVNRVWRWHFGRGIVPSVDNFGLLGEAPTHPELLDWLSLRFVESGWSLKALHRVILLSHTYQQASHPKPAALEKDPENRLWGWFPVRRLEAEAVRDALLSVSGQLDRTPGGPVLTVKNRGYLFDHTSKDLTKYDSPRRSIYLPVIRNNVYDVFQLLDYPDAAVSSGDRNTSTVSPQALLMLNSDLVLQASDKLADRLLREFPADESARVARLIRLAYGRDPRSGEIAQLLTDLADYTQGVAESNASRNAIVTPAANRQAAWSVLCQTILAANEFIYVK